MGRLNFKKFKLFFLDIISFGSPQAISLNLILILLALAFLPVSSLGHIPAISLYGSVIIPGVFNNSCSSEGALANCGFYSIGQTRAISSLLHGDFQQAYNYNRLVFILFVLILLVLAFNLHRSYIFYRKTGKIFRYS